MNITPRPIIPVQLRGLDHFKGQKQMAWISTFGMQLLAVNIVTAIGLDGDTMLLGLCDKDLDVKVRDDSLLRLDELRFLKETIVDHTYESFVAFLANVKISHIDINRICACYYLDSLKRRHGGNINMNLLFKTVKEFKFPE